MKVLLKLFRGFLWLLLVLTLLALLTVLSWWMQWPLVTGAVIFLSLIGLVLGVLGLRALYRWHDKVRFVRKVLDEQSAMDAATPVVLGRMTEAWQKGMEVLHSSPLRFHERLEFSQPWFVVLDTTENSFSLFTPLGETLPENTDSPLFWHFLTSSVLLHCSETKTTAEDWKELLAKLTHYRRRIPLRGVILLLSVADIARRTNEELTILGRQLRSKAQQLMLTLNRRYPIYVLVEGLDALPGMDKILDIVPAEDFNAVLGQAEQTSADARVAAETASAQLEDMLRAASADGRQPEGDMLEALRSLRALGTRLHMTVEQISRDVAHQTQLLLAGICFCQRGETNGRNPAFLTALLSYVLPSSPSPTMLTHGLPFIANTRACIMAAWLLLLLGICGLMSVNVLYQHQALNEAPPITTSISHNPTFDKLYQQMVHIQQLEKAQNSWHLPQFGLDALSGFLKKARAIFIDSVYANIISPMLENYHAHLDGKKSMTREEERQMRWEILWLTDVVADRMQSGEKGNEGRKPFPIAKLNSDWRPVAARLIVNAIYWMTDGEQITIFAREIRSLLVASLMRRGDNALDDLLDDVNGRYPAAKVCLSQFWPHLNSSDPQNVCVKPAYTATGYKAFKDSLEDLETLDDKSRTIRQCTNALRSDYFRRYAELWQNFSKAFARIRVSMQEGDVFTSYTDINKIEDMPHYRAIQRLSSELKPLQDAGNDTPRWLSSFLLMSLVVDIAELEQRHEATNRVRSFLTVLTSAPEILQRLRAETKDSKQARQMFAIAESVKAYFDDTLSLLQVVASPENSYALASAWFGGHPLGTGKPAPASTSSGKTVEADTEDLYANAKKQLNGILAPFKGNGQNPMLYLFPGMLDFIAQGVTVQTAKVVQKAWENDVLDSSTALYRQDDVSALFGEKGVVQNFVNARLKPFLTHRNKTLAAARWDDIEFPFTTDGLNALSQAEMIAAQPPKDTYYVQLRSQPTLVNVEARERADSTTLTLQCQDKDYTLVNRNYPREEKFQYTVKQCSSTTLEIAFPSLTLKKSYATFTDFLKDFQYGERDFSSDDFENAGDKMQSVGLETVTVRILPDNVSSVLEREGNAPPTLPDRLTYVW